ncbi:uncharacterized protein LOC115819431 [Chanos chanos]|uniref:Uncharacterized protein LOC115819431 n=1 Tax=Chanos chanos TaxID=29144 RepID=A0A6J2W3J9_CHACN|nr:uncharacterized protein LOC115819431 [Chanos chanos]
MFSVSLVLLLAATSYVHSDELIQPDFQTVRPGQQMTINCKVSYSVTDYATAWIRQSEGKAPEYIGYIDSDGSLDYKESLKNKFSISRDTSSNTIILQGNSVQTEDTAVYYCARYTQYYELAAIQYKNLYVGICEKHHLRGLQEVIQRYQQVLKTFGKVRTMIEAFHRHNIDRRTIAATAPIAKLHIADPKAYSTLEFEPAVETLLGFAEKCANHVTPDIKKSIEDLKASGHLLPIMLKY